MTDVYSSSLDKAEFFQRIGKFSIENILSVKKGYGDTGRPTGFVIGGIWVSVFVGPEDSIWVSLSNKGNPPTLKESLEKELRLSHCETYPYALESPSEEVTGVWEKALRGNKMARYLEFYNSALGQMILKAEAAYVKEWLKGCKTVLDIGCGPGVFEKELSDMNIVGIDPSADMLQLARSQNRDVFTPGKAESLPFQDSCFDGVFFIASLEFAEDYKLAIDEAARVLKEGGKIVILMLNPESEYFKKMMEGGGYTAANIRHTNIKEIEEYLSKKFEVSGEYMLGIQGDVVFPSGDPTQASIYALKGRKMAGPLS
jgi:SAM-dependent methyltransferase